MSELPVEVVTEILSRVPIESLLRFRCVSKPWCSLIDTPHFIKTHLNRSIENHTNLTLILREMGDQITLYSLDFSSHHTPIPFNKHIKDSYVLGCCNGLLLLNIRHHRQLVLFNPSTRHYRNVPATPIAYHPLDGSVNTRFAKYGLGYDSFNDDYKVIRVVQFYECHKWVKKEAKVYSLKSNLWREIEDFPYRLSCIGEKGWGAHVNGALHMIVWKSYNFDSAKLIAAFDITDTKFYLVPKPDFLDKNHVEAGVDVLGGCLCLMGYYPDYTDVWVMKVYGVKESWTKLLSISSPKIGSYIWVHPLDYSKSGGEVLFNFDGNKFIWYDLKRREIQNVELCDLPEMVFLEVCVGSLVPVDGYGGSGESNKQH